MFLLSFLIWMRSVESDDAELNLVNDMTEDRGNAEIWKTHFEMK